MRAVVMRMGLIAFFIAYSVRVELEIKIKLCAGIVFFSIEKQKNH